MQSDSHDADGSGTGGNRDEERVIAAALRMLAMRPRSETQLRERLMSKPQANGRLVDHCISHLKQLGYVNDDRFAESYATHRLSVRPIGRARLARELVRKKVDRKTVDRALDQVFDEHCEDDLIDRAIQKRMRTHGHPTDRADAKRMFDHLARLGFDFDLILRKLDALNRNNER